MLKKILKRFIETNHINFVLESMEAIGFVRLTPFALAPVRSTSQSAGLDLRSPGYTCLLPYSRELILTDLQIIIPSNCYGRLASRSGLSLNNCIDVAGGVIDRDYVGNVGVILVNNSRHTYYVYRGDKIAQLIIEKYVEPKTVIEVKTAVFDDNTNERGAKGFGSTGKK